MLTLPCYAGAEGNDKFSEAIDEITMGIVDAPNDLMLFKELNKIIDGTTPGDPEVLQYVLERCIRAKTDWHEDDELCLQETVIGAIFKISSTSKELAAAREALAESSAELAVMKAQLKGIQDTSIYGRISLEESRVHFSECIHADYSPSIKIPPKHARNPAFATSPSDKASICCPQA